MKSYSCILAAAVLFLLLLAPGIGRASTIYLYVQHNPISGNYATIQDAITYATTQIANTTTNANNQYIVKVLADTNPYTEPFTAVSNVWIEGASTSGTFLSGAATLSGVTNVTFRNFTYNNAAAAITVANSTQVTIENILFNLNGTAINTTGSTSVSIINNTFSHNTIAISTDSGATIINNIFYYNGTALSTQGAPALSYDLFYSNSTLGITLATLYGYIGCIPNQNAPTAVDPEFISTGNNGSFQLQPGSPAAGAGSPNYTNSFNSSSDMGAFGGPYSDVLLTAVTGVTSTLSSTTPPTMPVTWDALTTQGTITAYRVYYNTSLPVNSSSPYAPPVIVPFGTDSVTLSSLPPAAGVPATPTLDTLTSQNNALTVNWESVAGATGYQIYYGTTPFDATNLPTTSAVSSGTNTSYQLTGLTNGTTYYVAVAALAQTTVYAAVTAVVNTTLPSAPGTSNESPLSQVTSQTIGTQQVSPISGTLRAYPEAVSPYPNLKNEGCFIATAAYGFYSAPQVQVLRDFRDRYLLTNAPGRAFVGWYYRVGPHWAHFINLHPFLKAPVRLALFPLVVGSYLLLHTSTLAKIALLLLALFVSWLLLQRLQRKMLSQAGGLP